MFSCVLANVSLVRCWVVFLGGGKAKKKVKILGCRKDTNGHRRSQMLWRKPGRAALCGKRPWILHDFVLSEWRRGYSIFNNYLHLLVAIYFQYLNYIDKLPLFTYWTSFNSRIRRDVLMPVVWLLWTFHQCFHFGSNLSLDLRPVNFNAPPFKAPSVAKGPAMALRLGASRPQP